MTECTLDLTDDVTYPIIINKDRYLNKTIQAEIYSGTTKLGNFNFSGYTGATLQVRIKPTDAYTVLDFSTVDGSISLGLDGNFILFKNADELKNVKSGKFYYDMYLDSASAERRAFLKGEFIINETISR